MKMTNDPQHLITVSLGKIAMARTQRGGVNLHKNLLVASVLHRARTRYVMDSYIPLVSSRNNQNGETETEENNSPVIVAPYNSLTCTEQSVVGQTDKDVVTIGLDKENKPPSGESRLDMTDSADHIEDNNAINLNEEIRERLGITTRDQQNNAEPNPVAEQKDYIELSPVKSALKRRLSRQSSISSPQPLKRVRHTSNCDIYLDSYQSVASSPEPMQTEQQITSLVTIFNTGFNGLCSSGRSDAVVSCATELIDHNIPVFDLSLPMTPPIALSV